MVFPSVMQINSLHQRTNERNSNVELLRILSMLMVLILHLNESICDYENIWLFDLVESFCIVAVNIFVSISGFYSVRFSLRKLLKLYLQCFFIGLTAYFLYLAFMHDSFSWRIFCGRFLAFSHNHWWFVISYLGLLFLSPILNKGSDSISRRMYITLLVLFGVMEVYFGWIKGVDGFFHGYSIIHFCYIYLLARYVARFVSIEDIRSYRWLWFFIYIMCVLINFIFVGKGFSIHQVFAYNNPIIIVGAFSLLLFFLSFTFQNKWINWIAASAFAAYLLQESPYIGHKFYYVWEVERLGTYTNLFGRYGMLLLHCLAFFCIAIVIDKIISILINSCLICYDRFKMFILKR